MQRDKVKVAILEATSFINQATELLKVTAGDHICGSKKSGATRRASMDLTRSLANMRRA